jgi:glycosyltransferase involved in cell wall biosynthesis
MTKISVVIPSYNSRATIESCIESVLATGDGSLEIVVVDDASTDQSSVLIDALAARHPGVIRLVFQPNNGGPAKARNTGAKEASGELLFFLDSDTEILPDALKQFRLRIQEADAVVGIYHHEPTNKGWVPLYKALINYYFFARKGVIPYEVFDSSRAGIRKAVFDAAGGFNEDLGWGMDYENEELGYRLCRTYRMLLDPAVAARHQFPGFAKLTRVYFLRVALWMEVFLKRKKFESGGVTGADTGLATGSLLAAFCLSPLALLGFGWVPLILFIVYLWGYAGFFLFVFKTRPAFLPMGILLNIWFSLCIGAGAAWGLLRTLLGRQQASADMH